MGLFKRRAETQQELETLRTELRNMRERLDETDEVKARLAERLGHLDAENTRLVDQVGTVETRVGDVDRKVGTVETIVGTVEARVGSVADKVVNVETQVATVAGSIAPAIDSAVSQSSSAGDVETLRAEVTRLGGLTDQVDQLNKVVAAQSNAPAGSEPDALTGLKNQLADIVTALGRQQEQIVDVALVATDSAERTEHAEAKLSDLAAASDAADKTPVRDPDAENRQQVGQLAEKVSALDSRVNQVSLELTNQLTELSGDLDRASARADTADLVERLAEQLNDVTGGQERLANEQARHAIQFREDLAEIADRLRRPNTR